MLGDIRLYVMDEEERHRAHRQQSADDDERQEALDADSGDDLRPDGKAEAMVAASAITRLRVLSVTIMLIQVSLMTQ
jgi:hypothetical protein